MMLAQLTETAVCWAMKAFSTTEIAKILDVTPEWVRAQARGSIVAPVRTRQGHFRYSFQDIILLRAARRLRKPGISPTRIRRALSALSSNLPAGRSLSSVRLEPIGDRIVAGDEAIAWEPESGQTVIDFGAGPLRRNISLINRTYSALTKPQNPEDWFNLGLQYEHRRDEQNAELAYRRVCELDATHINARINLGRLRHAGDCLEDAEAFYRAALAIDPDHPIALFNLGVVLEDRGLVDAAMQSYRSAIDSDPEVAEAHYNLARLCAQQSEQLEAVKHYSRYRALTKKEDR